MTEKKIRKQALHWHAETDKDGIVWLSLDRADTSANSLSQAVLEELKTFLEKQIKHPPDGLIIRSAKKNGFIFGADIKEFTSLEDNTKAMALIRRGQHIMDMIESLPCPTLALINGVCMGGGTELALACDYRVADTDARLGLPEIKLGIHPGFGGVARSIPLLGAPAAMDMMLTGRTVFASPARRMGLLDAVVPLRQMKDAASYYINSRPRKRQAKWYLQLTSHPLIRPLLARYLRKQVSSKARKEHYPAPYALIDLWQRHGSNKRALLDAEATSVSQLMMTPTSRNLVRVFLLQDRLKSFGKDPAIDKNAFQHVHVIGGGIMGGDIAAWCASRGLKITLQETRKEAVASTLKRAGKLYKKRLRLKHRITSALDNIVADPDGNGLKKADVVIEAIYENMDAKHDLLKAVEPSLKPQALLASNTSSLMLEELDTVMSEPSRLVGLHFFNPVALMPLVEIVNGEQTAATVSSQAACFAHLLGKLPLPVKSSPGFLVNRILMPYLMEAMLLVEEGVSLTDIDRAATDFGMPMGPITLADTVGLDICLSVAKNLSEKLGGTVPKRLSDKVDAGKLGKKSGAGFYQWNKGKIIKPDGDATTPPTDITDRLILRLLNESIACLREGIVEDADLLDAGVIFGTGFAPFRGGPMRYIKETGETAIHNKLQQLSKLHGERFSPDAGWESMLTGE